MKLLVNDVFSVDANFYEFEEDEFSIEKTNLTKEQTTSFFDIFPTGTKINIKFDDKNYDLKVTDTSYQKQGFESLVHDKVSVNFRLWTASDDSEEEEMGLSERILLETFNNELDLEKLIQLLISKGLITKEEYKKYWNKEQWHGEFKKIHARFFEKELEEDKILD